MLNANYFTDDYRSIEVYSIDNINQYYNKFLNRNNSEDELSRNLKSDEVRYMLRRRELLKHCAVSIAYELHKLDDVLRYFFMHTPYDDWYIKALNYSKENGGKQYEDIDQHW